MSFGLLISPAGSAGVCRGSCSPERSRRHADLTTGRGLDCSRWPSPSSVLAHGQEQDLPGSLAVHPVTLRRSTTPDGPLRLANSGASGAAPTRLTMKASSFNDFEAARRFITCCLRFTTGVAARRARLASGWRAAPLPGGSRTRWIATRGFSSCHPPLQGFPWRNNRSSKPLSRPPGGSGWRAQQSCASSIFFTVRRSMPNRRRAIYPSADRRKMTLAGATQQLYRLSWRIPFFGKLASSSTPGYAAFILHHQDSAIALHRPSLVATDKGPCEWHIFAPLRPDRPDAPRGVLFLRC